MFSRVVGSLVLLAGLAATPVSGHADMLSPVFGAASVTPTTTVQNRAIVGKGYYADMYGSWGIDNANWSTYLGYYGYYNDAANYAYNAYVSFNAAAYYQAIGQ